MIKYKLVCNDCEITFDSWFASSKEFEKLKKKKLLACHICNSIKVDKTIMAPGLMNNKKDSKNSILSLIPWIIFGIILVVLGYFAFKFFVLNKSDDTEYEEYDVNYDDYEYDE